MTLTDTERNFVVAALRTAQQAHLASARALTMTDGAVDQHDKAEEAHRLAEVITGMDVSLATPPLSAERRAALDEIDKFLEEDFDPGFDPRKSLPCCGEPVPRLDTPTGETDCVSCGASFTSLLDAHHWEATFRPKDC
jgi:hypothetical protein